MSLQNCFSPLPAPISKTLHTFSEFQSFHFPKVKTGLSPVKKKYYKPIVWLQTSGSFGWNTSNKKWIVE